MSRLCCDLKTRKVDFKSENKILILLMVLTEGYLWYWLKGKPPCGSDGRVCLKCRRPGFDPWVGKIPWKRKWQPTPVILPGKSHGCRSLTGTVHGLTELYTTEWLHFPFHFFMALTLCDFESICGFQDLICRVSTDYLPPRVIARAKLRCCNTFVN